MRRTDGPFIIYEILPGQLFQRGKLHGMSEEIKLAGLDYYRITHSAALAPTRPDVHLVETAEDTGIWYTHLAIPDGLLPEVGGLTLLRLAAKLAKEIEGGGRVLTMCNAGRNRSGLLSALIVRELTGIPGSAAMAVVRHHRPNAIANPNFERFLEGLE